MKLYLLFLLAMFPLCGEEQGPLEHAWLSSYAARGMCADRNSSMSLMPASCLKLVTTGAALHLLGPEDRFETHLEYDGTIDAEKVLHGNIYIRGGGDPCLGSDRVPGNPSWQEQLHIWADALQKLGIKRIDGKILADASRWESALAEPSWNWEDLGNYYGAGACALSFHENAYSLYFQPGSRVGEKALVLRTDPPLPSLSLRNEVTTGPEGSGDQACIYGSELSWSQRVQGTVPTGVETFVIQGAIADPAGCCATLLSQEILKRGILIEQHSLPWEEKRTLVHTTLSPPVQEIVYWTNQKSINLYAEHLLKKMGELVYHEGSTKAGARAVLEFWKSQKVNVAGWNLVDGSGLSRKNLVTTQGLVAVLQKMQESKLFPLFLASLPDVEDGIKAKRGSASLILGYAGYVDGEPFALLINQCPDSLAAKKAAQTFLKALTPKSEQVSLTSPKERNTSLKSRGMGARTSTVSPVLGWGKESR